MILNMIPPKNDTEDLLLSITKAVKRLLNKFTHDQKNHWNLE